jgi:murein DD-endopeptidase MepM/ murein hydrolase activator NlpD
VLAVVFVAPVPSSAQDATTTTVPDTTTTTLGESTTTTTTSPGETTTTRPGATTTTTGPDGPDGPDVDPYDPSALQELLDSYDEAVAMEAELLAQFELSMEQINQLNQTMVLLNDTITQVEAELLDAEATLVEAEDRVELAEVQLADVERRLDEAHRLLEAQAVAAYVAGGSSPGVYALLSADSTDELETATAYAGAVKEETDSVIERFNRLEDEAQELRTEAREAAEEAEDARDEVEEQREALESERERQAKAQADAFVAALAQQGLIADIEAQRGSYEERLRTLAGSSDSINEALREAQEGQRLPQETDAIFLPPVEDPEISSSFGPRLHPIFGTVRMHNGLDIDTEMGRPLRAAADGTVVLADWQGGYGFTTVIDHGNGLATLYAHQSALIAHEGEEVEMGDILGLAGSTGWSTGPHVHWEVRVFGNPTDPITFLGGESLLFEDEGGD